MGSGASCEVVVRPDVDEVVAQPLVKIAKAPSTQRNGRKIFIMIRWLPDRYVRRKRVRLQKATFVHLIGIADAGRKQGRDEGPRQSLASLESVVQERFARQFGIASERHPYLGLRAASRRRNWPEHLHNVFLRLPHPRGIGGIAILVPVEMQQAVHDVSRGFAVGRFAVFTCLPGGGARADNDSPWSNVITSVAPGTFINWRWTRAITRSETTTTSTSPKSPSRVAPGPGWFRHRAAASVANVLQPREVERNRALAVDHAHHRDRHEITRAAAGAANARARSRSRSRCSRMAAAISGVAVDAPDSAVDFFG